mgnify:CR=1 FL=1
MVERTSSILINVRLPLVELPCCKDLNIFKEGINRLKAQKMMKN